MISLHDHGWSAGFFGERLYHPHVPYVLWLLSRYSCTTAPPEFLDAAPLLDSHLPKRLTYSLLSCMCADAVRGKVVEGDANTTHTLRSYQYSAFQGRATGSAESPQSKGLSPPAKNAVWRRASAARNLPVCFQNIGQVDWHPSMVRYHSAGAVITKETPSENPFVSSAEPCLVAPYHLVVWAALFDAKG